MRFEVSQHFDASPDRVLANYVDPELYASLGALGSLSAPDLLAHDVNGEQVRLQLRYWYVGDLPPGAGRVIRRDRLSWVQDCRTDLSTGVTSLTIVPDEYADRLSAAASITISPDDDKPAGEGARRVVRGELKVQAALVAGRVERVIIDGLKDHLRLEAVAVTDRLRAA